MAGIVPERAMLSPFRIADMEYATDEIARLGLEAHNRRPSYDHGKIAFEQAALAEAGRARREAGLTAQDLTLSTTSPRCWR